MSLFELITIKDMTLKNKIVLAPMCMYQAKDGFSNMFHLIHYTTRAIGQMGLIIVEATAVKEEGQITRHDLGIWSDDHINPLKQIVDEVHKHGAKIGIQLAHAGRKAKDAKIPLAPSAIPFGNYKMPKTMTIDEIEDVKDAFKEGARRAYQAGFDFIEIHAAHGYLINEFLSPLSNERTDRYGGSVDNRNRLLFEIIDKVREVWPLSKPLGIRISATEYDKEGLDVNYHIKMLNQIKGNKVDIINVSTGGVIPKKIDAYSGYQLSYAKQIKENTTFLVMAGGLIESPQLAENVLSSNEADLIYFGRLALKDPYFPLRFAQSLNVDITWPEYYYRAKP